MFRFTAPLFQQQQKAGATEAEIAAAKLKHGKFNAKLFIRSGCIGYLGVGTVIAIFTMFSWPNPKQWESMDTINHLIFEHKKKLAEKKEAAKSQQL